MNQNKRFIVIGLVALIVIALIVQFFMRHQSILSGKPRVVASFYPLAYFTERIVGDKAAVVNLTPAGSEPHDYEPTARQIADLEKSSVLVLNGGGLESWAPDVEKNLINTKVAVVEAGSALANKTIAEEGKTITDPHVWLSPKLAKLEVDTIASVLVQADPTNGLYYRANEQALTKDLDALDQEYTTRLASCARRDIITSHAAFGYLAADYNLRQIPIVLSPDAEPSLAEIATIADLAKQTGATHIFSETLVSPKFAETIAREAGAQTLVLDPLEGLTDQDLAAGKNYLTVMRSNLDNLTLALGCN